MLGTQPFYIARLSAGYKCDTWVKGCQVVAEHEASKAYREAEEAEKTRVSVQKQGGLSRTQMQRDDATIIAMLALLWLVKDSVAPSKWDSLKGMVKFWKFYI